MERLRNENEALRQSMGTQAVIERNAKIQDSEERNQELRVKLQDIRLKSVELEKERDRLQQRIDVLLAQNGDAPLKTDEGIEQDPKMESVSEDGLVFDSPKCPKCGSEEIKPHERLIKIPEGYSKRWQCKKCKKTWVRRAIAANN